MKFFIMQNPNAERGDAVTDYLPVDGSRTGDAPRCPSCGGCLGMLPLLPPVRVELEAWGARWGDVAFGPGDQILISDKLKQVNAKVGLQGFERFDRVDILRMKSRKAGTGEPPRYWLASIRRSRAVLDEAASGLVRERAPMCEECRIGGIIKRVDRAVLQANSWSGEDVFFARGLPGTIFVNERFKLLCEANDLANCSLVAAANFSFDYYPQECSPNNSRH
jgi:hypothetical protein